MRPKSQATNHNGDAAPPARTPVVPQKSAPAPPPSFAPRATAPASAQSTPEPTLQAVPTPAPPSFQPQQRKEPTSQPAAAARRYGAGSSAPPAALERNAPTKPGRPKRSRRRRAGSARRTITGVLTVLLVAIVAWPIWLVWHTNANLNRVDATSDFGNTRGTTYIFAGSDSRDGWNPEDPTEGERSDSTIMVHRAPNGQASMVSLPRDSYLEIPGYGYNKLNAAFSLGGPKLLVETVELNTGVKVDHYVQIGMVGVTDIVDALGGVELCWDYDVNDELSGMQWTAGCHESDGAEALAFSRMRYSDPLGDVGRQMRQRQVMGAVVDEALTPSVLLNPVKQLQLSDAAASTLTVGNNTNVWNIAMLMLAMRKATSAGLVGTPPIADPNAYNEVGSVMLWGESAPTFFQRMLDGTLTESDFRVM